jgi:hypothetical protein
MKLSIFPRYGAQNSKPVFAAFEKGAKKLGFEVVEHDMNADGFVIWSVLWQGNMSQNRPIWEYARKNNKTLIILEVGCLKRNETWKVGLNHINNLGFFANNTNLIPNRSKKLGILLRPWTMSGSNILICGQHTKSEQWSNKDTPINWLKNTIDDIKKHTSRQIIFRPHPRDFLWAQHFTYKNIKVRVPRKIQGTYDDFNFDDDLSNAWTVVNPSSNTGILSIVNGIPAYVESESLALPVANTQFSNIETPVRPNRSEWFEKLCHTEWTIEEIEQGIPLNRIFTLNS